MMKALLLVTAATLALTGGATAAANHMPAAGGAHGTGHRAIHAPRGVATLYDQNIGDASYGWFSQTLSSYPQYSEYLADDFVVPPGHTWKVNEVDTLGFYDNGPGPSKKVNVLFWNDKNGLPNKNSKAAECDNITPETDNAGSFQISLPRNCPVRLTGTRKGTRYWLTVQAQLAGINTSGYWAWLANSTVANKNAAGYYYGGGNSVTDTRCLARFKTISDCWGAGPVDLAFALLGKDITH